MPHANTDEAPVLADSSAPESTARELAGQLITFMESGTPPEGLFTADVFCDFTMPQWRLQSQGIDDLVAMRKAGHAGPSSVPRSPSSRHWTASTSTTAHSPGNCATRCGPVARAATTRIPPA